MTASDLASAYARVCDLYQRQLELLATDQPDLDALAALGAAVDAELVRMPTSDRLPALDREQAAGLATAARTADALRARAVSRLGELRAAQALQAAVGERAAGAARAYRPQVEPDTARFLDQRR